MTAVKARKCFVPRSPSDWVAKVFLTCDNMLAVQFKRGQKVRKLLPHGPGAYLGVGGVPSMCCLYPGTQGDLAERLYELAKVWAYAGEWVHVFLYKKFGYRLVPAPAVCGGCNTSCSISANPATPTAGQSVTIACTITNTDGSPTRGDAPQGTVAFSIDGANLDTVSLPANEPDTQNYASASLGWTATSGTHTLEAIYTPSSSDYAAVNCSMTLTASGGSIVTSCCPNGLPTTLHATIANVSGCASLAGTYPLTWNGSLWLYTAVSGLSIGLQCDANTSTWLCSLECPNNSGGQSAPASSASCNPVNIVFSNVAFSSSATCCSGGGGTINITVTT
jgi:hypothetical protein